MGDVNVMDALGINQIELEHSIDWDDIALLTLAIFVAVVFGIIVGHSILKQF
jgi:hypothetical protein